MWGYPRLRAINIINILIHSKHLSSYGSGIEYESGEVMDMPNFPDMEGCKSYEDE